MEQSAHNLTVFNFMWLNLIWEEQPLNKSMFIVLKRLGQEYINIK